MAKFYGKIGFASISTETAPGVWSDEVVERNYTGDVITNTRRWQSGEDVNPDIVISETISIVADDYTLVNMHAIKYVIWRGEKWSVNSIKIERPRMILEIGGLYNG